MGELYGTCALLAAVLFFVLLQKFESRLGKVDKELGEIKKRMDDLLKALEKFPAKWPQQILFQGKRLISAA